MGWECGLGGAQYSTVRKRVGMTPGSGSRLSRFAVSRNVRRSHTHSRKLGPAHN